MGAEKDGIRVVANVARAAEPVDEAGLLEIAVGVEECYVHRLG